MQNIASLLAVCVLCASAFGARAERVDQTANPIRKIVGLMQDMQKEIAAEGDKEKELYDKFMCFCETGEGELATSVEAAKAKISELSAKLESESAEKNQLDQELADHKADREQAKADVEKATGLRTQEKAEYDAAAAEDAANIKALSSALPALEQGMGGAALLQVAGGARLKKLVENTAAIDDYERQNVVAFLESKESGDYAPQSGQIVGIMKQMLETMQKEAADAAAEEAQAAAGFLELKGSKDKEIRAATSAIESKTERTGELAVSVVQTQSGLDDAQKEQKENEEMLATLKTQCVSKTKEFQVRRGNRAAEVAAISEAIAILNDDDALDVFKKAVPAAAGAFTQGSVGFLQARAGRAGKLEKALTILEGSASTTKSTPLALIAYTMHSKIRLGAKSKAQNFGMILNMIDQMVVILGKEQKEDDDQKAYCDDELNKSEDEKKAAETKIASQEARTSELKDGVNVLKGEIETLTASVKALDKSVAAATEQRKEEHAEFSASATLNGAAVALLEKAKNRLNKFYNPVLYKAPPKAPELSAEDAMAAKAGFGAAALVQVRAHVQEGASVFQPKKDKATGVLALMDMMMEELNTDVKDAEDEEKNAQKEYAELMGESSATRAQTVQSITDKSGTKAQLETKISTTSEAKALTTESLEDVSLTISHLHTTCDFLIENFDARKEARSNEMDSLKNGKAVLSGADFGF